MTLEFSVIACFIALKTKVTMKVARRGGVSGCSRKGKTVKRMLQPTGGMATSAAQSTYIFLILKRSEDYFLALVYLAAGAQCARNRGGDARRLGL